MPHAVKKGIGILEIILWEDWKTIYFWCGKWYGKHSGSVRIKLPNGVKLNVNEKKNVIEKIWTGLILMRQVLLNGVGWNIVLKLVALKIISRNEIKINQSNDLCILINFHLCCCESHKSWKVTGWEDSLTNAKFNCLKDNLYTSISLRDAIVISSLGLREIRLKYLICWFLHTQIYSI